MPTTRNPRAHPPAFTIVELLVVIGIILILMSILLPVVSKIRYASYDADTENEISQISNACNQYYSTFNAYPGPLSNDQIEKATAQNPPIELEGFVNGQPNHVFKPAYVTGTENLVLGLMGGLHPQDTSISGTPAPVYPFNPSEVGLGPMSLNANLPGRTASFLPNGSTYLMWCEKTSAGIIFQTTSYQANDSAGNPLTLAKFTDLAQTQANDSIVPEFVDRFPSPGPLPILYLRARSGASGVISYYTATSNVVTDPTGNPAQYQYDLGDIIGYTNTHIGLPAIDSHGNPETHNLAGVNKLWNTATTPPQYYTVSQYPSVDTTTPHANAGPYFANPSITPTNTTNGDSYVNNTGRPRAVDQFILISAGPDGIYGTADDITSFGSVSQ